MIFQSPRCSLCRPLPAPHLLSALAALLLMPACCWCALGLTRGCVAAGNSTVFGAPPSAYTLPYAALVAGDVSKYALRASIEGTEFQATTPKAALPSSITLNAAGIACSPANLTATASTSEATHPPTPAPPLLGLRPLLALPSVCEMACALCLVFHAA